MYSVTRRRDVRLSRHARGFSLIELGIVIAVIAVLASVVIFGRGFITAGRVSKTVEGINTIRKAGAAFAGLTGGFLQNSTTNEIPALARRSLLPVADDATSWVVAGDPASDDRFEVRDIRFGQVRSGNRNHNAVLVHIRAPDGVQAQDLYRTSLTDQNFVQTGDRIGGLQCANSEPSVSATDVYLCFKL